MSQRTSRRLTWAVGIALLLGGVAFAISRSGGDEDAGAAGNRFRVRNGPLRISVNESGTIQNLEQVVIRSEVEGRTAILSLAAEGKRVEKGDLLVELDVSGLEEQRAGKQITVINAEAAFIRAREDLAVARSQSESDIAKAELDLKFAQLDRNKYIEGEYPQQLQQADGEITIAREEVQRAADKLDWSKKLHEQRYLSLIELQADELALKKANLDLELAQGKKSLLEQFTHQRDREAYRATIDQARMALDRVQRKAAADLVQAEAELKAKDSEFRRQTNQLEKIVQQISKCRIVAPVSGMVVYATTGRGGWRNNQEPLEEGQDVRERQDLIYLPTDTSMMAEVKIHESSLEKVELGLPVRVTVDALPGKVFHGRIVKIARLPDSQSAWLNPDLKLYNSEVHLDGDGSDLRPGMSCRAEIVVETYPSAVHIPLQAVVRVDGKPTVYLPGGADGPVARTIRVGLDNNRMIHVLEGLAAGELVLLDPPLTAGEAPALPAEAPAEKAAAKPTGKVDWKSMTPEQRKKLREQRKTPAGQ